MEDYDMNIVPEDEAITVPDLSKVFDDDDGEPDPFDPDVVASDVELPRYEEEEPN